MNKRKRILAACLCVSSSAVLADSNMEYHIDGFLTAGFGVLTGGQVFTQQLDANTLESQILAGLPPLYDTVLARPSIYGYNGKLDLQQPSIIGVNGRLDINDEYSVLLQITGLGATDFEANVEWAFLEYKPNQNWDFRFGRMRIPLFMFSDTVNVGYTYPWVSPPNEIYQFVGFSTYSAAEMVYENELWGQNLRATLYYGVFSTSNISVGFSGTFTAKQLFGGYFTYGNPDIYFRMQYGEGYLQDVLPTPALATIIQAYTTIYGAPDVASGYEYNNTRAYFEEIGINIDKGHWVFLAEVVKQGTNSPQFKTTLEMYATLGYKIYEDWLPFVGFAQEKTLDKATRIYGGLLGEALNPLLAQVNTDQKTVTLGMRWDVFTNTDLKLQVERIDPTHGTMGTYSVNPNQADYLIRGTVDTVF